MSLGFSRQEYWSGLSFPAPDDLPDSGLKPVSPVLAGTFFPTEPSGKPLYDFQFSSVIQSYPTLCHPMNLSTPGLPVNHKLPQFTESHDHRVGDAIQPSHPLSSLSPAAPIPSQHQGLFQ